MSTRAGITTNGVTISQVLRTATAENAVTGQSFDLDQDGLTGAADQSDEFVEISNTSDVPVDVSGWQIWVSRDGGGADGRAYHTFAPGTVLQPGESVYVITEYSGTPPEGVVEANGDGTESFANDTNLIFDGANAEVALVNHTDQEYIQMTWDYSPDNITNYDASLAGYTRQTGIEDTTGALDTAYNQGYINANQILVGNMTDYQDTTVVNYDPDAPDGAVLGLTRGHTFPGATETTFSTTQAGVDLNGLSFYEALTDNNAGPAVFDVDGDGTVSNSDQYISFVNTTGGDLDISGLQIWSTDQSSATNVKLFHTFDPGTVLAAGEVIYVVTEYTGDPSLDTRGNIVEGNGNANPTNTSQFLRAAANGDIALLDPTTGEYIQMSWGTPTNINSDADFAAAAGTPTQIGVIQAQANADNGGAQPSNNEAYRYDYDTGLVTEYSQYSSLPVCFCAGTEIATQKGAIKVERLAVGDMVLTMDNGYQALRWIGGQRLSAARLAGAPHLRPIRIRAGALGEGMPERDLMVSPQHRVLVASDVAERMFDQREVLIAAKHLLAIDGVEVAEDLVEVTYWHFLFDSHQVVFSNGAATESLYTGPEALKAVSPAARAEILEIFPELAEPLLAYREPARLLVPGRRARRLADRISRNGKQLAA